MPGKRGSPADEHEIVHLHQILAAQKALHQDLAQLASLVETSRTTILRAITNGVNKTMASLAEVKADLEQLKADVAAERVEEADRAAASTAQIGALTAEVQRLTDLIAAGGSVTAADMDGLRATVAEIDASVKNIVNPTDAPTP